MYKDVPLFYLFVVLKILPLLHSPVLFVVLSKLVLSINAKVLDSFICISDAGDSILFVHRP